MKKWADRLQAHRAALIEADSIDTGYGQISRVAADMVIGSVLRMCAIAPAIFERSHRAGNSPGAPNVAYRTNLRPYPLAGIIGPWNAPLMLSTLHAVPALFAGCAVIVKPSEVTPRFVKPMMETILEVPELAEVFIFVVGDGETGQAIVDNVDIVNLRAAFRTGERLRKPAQRDYSSILELGGKDPVIVTQTADLQKAAKAVLRGAVTSTGQVCFSIERIYVQEKVHDAFVAILVKEAERVELNYPDPNRGQIGPFIAERQSAIVDDHLDDAVRKGAKIRTGDKSENLAVGSTCGRQF